jgi:putative pyruvate formate lyase activating enzyme
VTPEDPTIDAPPAPGAGAQPYRALHASGELARRAAALRELARDCPLCPHACHVARLDGRLGFCRMPAGAVVAASTAHFGEEPEVSGTRGSGTVFFGGCNLRCLYCQNAAISQGSGTRDVPADSVDGLAARYLDLAARGVHNLNWVTPSHVGPWAVAALDRAAAQGLALPLVYNSSGYDAMDTLRLLDGVVDVYLPDLRYADDESARDCSGIPGYVDASRAAVLEMARQVGTRNVHGPDGTIRRGLVVRLLVLPNDLSGTRETLAFLRSEVGTHLRIALMSQYFPTHRAADEVLLSRRTSVREYQRVVDLAERMGFDNALVQEMEAQDFYRPDFGRGDEPFADAAAFGPDPGGKGEGTR